MFKRRKRIPFDAIYESAAAATASDPNAKAIRGAVLMGKPHGGPVTKRFAEIAKQVGDNQLSAQWLVFFLELDLSDWEKWHGFGADDDYPRTLEAVDAFSADEAARAALVEWTGEDGLAGGLNVLPFAFQRAFLENVAERRFDIDFHSLSWHIEDDGLLLVRNVGKVNVEWTAINPEHRDEYEDIVGAAFVQAFKG